jgi:hypothetical protein
MKRIENYVTLVLPFIRAKIIGNNTTEMSLMHTHECIVLLYKLSE